MAVAKRTVRCVDHEAYSMVIRLVYRARPVYVKVKNPATSLRQRTSIMTVNVRVLLVILVAAATSAFATPAADSYKNRRTVDIEDAGAVGKSWAPLFHTHNLICDYSRKYDLSR